MANNIFDEAPPIAPPDIALLSAPVKTDQTAREVLGPLFTIGFRLPR